SIRASSVTEGDGGFSAVLALDRYYAPNKCPVLHVRVQVKRPHRSLSTAYHGAVPLSSSLSSAGTAVQETKGLMQEAEMQARAKETRAHTVPKKMASSFSGNVDDDRISMTE
ncbi:unnamed protein product, partial [Pylaiella littoralis]